MLSEGAGTDDPDSDSELQFQLMEHIDQLSDKKWAYYTCLITSYILAILYKTSSHTRAAALLYLNKTLKQRVVSGHIQGRYVIWRRHFRCLLVSFVERRLW